MFYFLQNELEGLKVSSVMILSLLFPFQRRLPQTGPQQVTLIIIHVYIIMYVPSQKCIKIATQQSKHYKIANVFVTMFKMVMYL